jgi:tetratricopeptide (TPR) repeat protein
MVKWEKSLAKKNSMANIFRRLPVQVTIGALVFYGLTLSHGVTLNSLALTAKIAGWDWRPLAGHPLLWLLTLPMRLLPAAWVAVALNLFSAVCGALTLGILTRSLELLPWIRPLGTLQGWSARLPTFLAVAACGLELTFWQNATAGIGEILGLLLLAAAVWCLLEYRVSRDVRWLKAAAVIWGAGMAEDWAMLFALPLYVGTLVWLRKFKFFNLRFISSMAGLGLAGFAIYALPPMANGLSPDSPWNLHTAWVNSFNETKHILLLVYVGFWKTHRLVTLAILLFYLIPLLAILARYGNEATKNKSPLDRMLIWVFRSVRVGLLLFCVWLAFNTNFGPRQIAAQQIHVGLPMLTFDYLNALCLGFLAGNFLLIPRREESLRRQKLGRRLTRFMERATAPLLTTLLAVIMLGLGMRNLPAIVLVNRQPLVQFGEFALHNLPPGNGILISDNPEMLEVFQAAQAQSRDKQEWLPLDTLSLPLPEYRARLQRRHAGNWLTSTNRLELPPEDMLKLVYGLTQTNPVFYLHPSFGYFFEFLYQQPNGSVFELKRLPAKSINPPPLTATLFRQNEKIWDDQTPQIESLQRDGSPEKSSLVTPVEDFLRLEPVTVGQVGLLKEWYSMLLNNWGVELQINGQLPAAQRRFSQALELNTNNWVALVNLQCNTNLQAGTKMALGNAAGFVQQGGSSKQLELFMKRLGPLDDPSFCVFLGNFYQESGLPRLAMQQFGRVHELVPEALIPQISLARLEVLSGLPDQAMVLISLLRSEEKKMPPNADMDVQLALLETSVWLSQTNFSRAGNVLQAVVQQHPDDDQIINEIAKTYVSFGDFTNAEHLITRLLARNPDDISALMTRSGILLQTERAHLALPVLNHVLTLTNRPDAMLNRAIAYIQTSNYPAATADCLELDNSLPKCYLAEYRLAQIAVLQHDTNQAVHYLQICLTNAPPGTPLWREVQARLQGFKSDSK